MQGFATPWQEFNDNALEAKLKPFEDGDTSPQTHLQTTRQILISFLLLAPSLVLAGPDLSQENT
eukprot:1159123-Pelagomonas_calceolata.AAC.10